MPKNQIIRKPHLSLDTYVFIDVSNIREACRKGCKFEIDFPKFYNYFKTKYPNLKSVYYYEGMASGDKAKSRHFKFLAQKGYIIRALKRKTYVSPALKRNFKCPNCAKRFQAEAMPKIVKMKSNVDVFLASDILELVATNKNPIHIILVSCDGDYAEAIEAALRINPNALVTVLATPITKGNNFLSTRIKALSKKIDRQHFKLNDISKIAQKISK